MKSLILLLILVIVFFLGIYFLKKNSVKNSEKNLKLLRNLNNCIFPNKLFSDNKLLLLLPTKNFLPLKIFSDELQKINIIETYEKKFEMSFWIFLNNDGEKEYDFAWDIKYDLSFEKNDLLFFSLHLQTSFNLSTKTIDFWLSNEDYTAKKSTEEKNFYFLHLSIDGTKLSWFIDGILEQEFIIDRLNIDPEKIKLSVEEYSTGSMSNVIFYNLCFNFSATPPIELFSENNRILKENFQSPELISCILKNSLLKEKKEKLLKTLGINNF